MDDTGGQSLAAFGLCLAARQSIVEKQMGADPTLPGPGAYIDPLKEGRGDNGGMKATLSHQHCVPSISFGKEGFNDHGRPIEKQLNSADLVGPKYTLDNITCGMQVQSRMKSAPNAAFSKGPQRYHGGKDFRDKMVEPSPQQYETENLRRGVMMMSTKRSPAGVKFSTGPRTYNDADERKNKALPAPGQYRAQPAIGKQVESRYREGQQFTMHGGRRDFTKANSHKEPGPGHYIDPAKEGRNERGECKAVLSRQKSFPSAVFGQAQARPSSAPPGSRKSPGPNQYRIPPALGTQPSSKYRSSPQFSFGAR